MRVFACSLRRPTAYGLDIVKSLLHGVVDTYSMRETSDVADTVYLLLKHKPVVRARALSVLGRATARLDARRARGCVANAGPAVGPPGNERVARRRNRGAADRGPALGAPAVPPRSPGRQQRVARFRLLQLPRTRPPLPAARRPARALAEPVPAGRITFCRGPSPARPPARPPARACARARPTLFRCHAHTMYAHCIDRRLGLSDRAKGAQSAGRGPDGATYWKGRKRAGRGDVCQIGLHFFFSAFSLLPRPLFSFPSLFLLFALSPLASLCPSLLPFLSFPLLSSPLFSALFSARIPLEFRSTADLIDADVACAKRGKQRALE